MSLKFRDLRADEIECRVGTVNKEGKGFSLLLYKDARCDQNILDETVGAMNWQRSHCRDNANCIVSIWDDDKKEWVSKEDTGTESNTEKEKGLASDSFKRSCFNWGIGRKLYKSPFIWLTEGDPKKDRFEVKEITYTEQAVDKLVIINSKTGKVVFSTKNKGNAKVQPEDDDKVSKENIDKLAESYINVHSVNVIKQLIEETNTDTQMYLDFIGADSIEHIKNKDYKRAYSSLMKKKEQTK